MNIYRICEVERAIEFLQATKFFKDDIYTKCALCQSPGDVFAADVYYHANCYSSYILQFKRDVEKLLEDDFCNNVKDRETNKLINEALDKLDLASAAYSVSTVCDNVNEFLKSKSKGMRIIFTK